MLFEVKNMVYTSRKKRSSRLGVRMLGFLFIIFALFYIVHYLLNGSAGIATIGFIIAIVFFMIGAIYIKQSFSDSAYDIVYKILPEYLELETHRGIKQISYDKIKDVRLSKVSEDMDYYVIHILTEKYNLVMHVVSESEKAKQMYQLLLEYTKKEEH